MSVEDDDTPDRGVVLAELIDRAMRQAIAERIRSMLPARVQKFNASEQKADCKILIGDFHRNEEGALVTESVPIVCGVPVVFLTAGGFTFTVPIEAGDNGTTGALLFADRSMDRWLSGQGQEVVDPEIYARNCLTDAVFIPGLFTFAKPMSVAPPTDHATAGSITGKRIHFRDGTICIGDESGSEPAVLGDTLKGHLDAIKSHLDTLKTTLASHTHGPGNTAAATGPMIQTPPTPPSVPTIQASQAKVK